jgi:hypothetical protein
MTTMHDLLPLQSPLLSSTKFTISTLMFLGDFYTITTSVASAIGQSVTTSSTDFSFQNLVFWNFQWQKSFQIQYLPHSESKSYQIDFIKSCSSKSFQQHQRHIPIPQKFSAII